MTDYKRALELAKLLQETAYKIGDTSFHDATDDVAQALLQAEEMLKWAERVILIEDKLSDNEEWLSKRHEMTGEQ